MDLHMDRGIRAINWLQKNFESLEQFLQGRDGPFGDDLRELKEVLGYGDGRVSGQGRVRHLYIVAVEVPSGFYSKVIDNYVTNALRKFDRISDKAKEQRYFDGLLNMPKFKVERILDEGTKVDFIRDSVFLIKQLNDFANKFENTIEQSEKDRNPL